MKYKVIQLFVHNTPFGNLKLIPMTNTKFIDLESGTKIEFSVDKKVDGFMVNNNYKFKKIE